MQSGRAAAECVCMGGGGLLCNLKTDGKERSKRGLRRQTQGRRVTPKEEKAPFLFTSEEQDTSLLLGCHLWGQTLGPFV